MKKYLSVLLIICTVLILSGCEPKESVNTNPRGAVRETGEVSAAADAITATDAVTQAAQTPPEPQTGQTTPGAETAQTEPATQPPATQPPATQPPMARVDIDIAAMSNTVAFATINDMFANLSNYLGKTVKVRGVYFTIPDQAGGFYHLLEIAGDGDCCPKIIDFVPLANLPPTNTTIDVIGAIGTVMIEGRAYPLIESVSITIIN
jgi:hypothetical protein